MVYKTIVRYENEKIRSRCTHRCVRGNVNIYICSQAADKDEDCDTDIEPVSKCLCPIKKNKKQKFSENNEKTISFSAQKDDIICCCPSRNTKTKKKSKPLCTCNSRHRKIDNAVKCDAKCNIKNIPKNSRQICLCDKTKKEANHRVVSRKDDAFIVDADDLIDDAYKGSVNLPRLNKLHLGKIKRSVPITFKRSGMIFTVSRTYLKNKQKRDWNVNCAYASKNKNLERIQNTAKKNVQTENALNCKTMPNKLWSKISGATSTFKIRRKGFFGLEEDSSIGSFSNFKAIRYKACCCRISETSSKAVEYPRKRRPCLCRRTNNRQLIEASRFLRDKGISSERHQRVRIVEESLSPRKQNNNNKKKVAEPRLKMIDARCKRVCA